MSWVSAKCRNKTKKKTIISVFSGKITFIFIVLYFYVISSPMKYFPIQALLYCYLKTKFDLANYLIYKSTSRLSEVSVRTI